MKKLIISLLIATSLFGCVPAEKSIEESQPVEKAPIIKDMGPKIVEEKPTSTVTPKEATIALEMPEENQLLTKGLYKGYIAIFTENYENTRVNILELQFPTTKELIFFIDSDRSGNIGTSTHDQYIHTDSNGFIRMYYTLGKALIILNKKIVKINPLNAMMEVNAEYVDILEQLNNN